MTEPNAAMLSLSALDRLVGTGDVDTVIVAFADMQGRLVGKRLDARLFVDEVAAHGAECCGYLLAVDVDMNTVGGYAMSSWDTGYGDMVMRPDLSTLRRIPVAARDRAGDRRRGLGTTAARSPCRRGRCCAASSTGWRERGLAADVATELEFIVFDEPYRQAWATGYRGLTPASDYNIDYAISASSRMEPLLRDIRQGMIGAGLRFEAVKGECNRGQQEIGFRYADALVTCDNHAIYKNGAKEIADQHGKSLTFMAKYDEREGQQLSHSPLAARCDGAARCSPTPAARTACRRRSAVSSPACWPPCATSRCSMRRTSTPTSDSPMAVSRRRRWRGDWTIAPARCGSSATGTNMRVECRVPGGDVNPYLAVAALIAGGLYGIERGLELPEPCAGNAYQAPGVERLPATLAEAAAVFERSTLARDVFGDDVVAHYLNNARVELAAFNAAVTDWERTRGFERL